MRVLLVEDEPHAANVLAKGLREQAYAVDLVADGDTAVFQAGTTDYDAVILDIMIPVMDGFSVCRAIRAAGCAVPILMVTARDAVEARIQGLDAGADDYLVKPFSFLELVARLQALTRRGRTQESSQLRVGDLQIDLLARKVTRDDTRIDLTAKEFALLCVLAKRHGEVLSKTAIAELVWDMNFDSDTNVVDVAMRRLRAKVDDPFEVKLIRTIRGVGYVLEEPLV